MTKNAAAYACMSCGFWGCVAVADDEWEAHPRAAEVFTAYPTKVYLNLFHPRVLGLGA